MLDEHSADVYDLECNFTSFKAHFHGKNDFLSFQSGFFGKIVDIVNWKHPFNTAQDIKTISCMNVSLTQVYFVKLHWHIFTYFKYKKGKQIGKKDKIQLTSKYNRIQCYASQISLSCLYI